MFRLVAMIAAMAAFVVVDASSTTPAAHAEHGDHHGDHHGDSSASAGSSSAGAASNANEGSAYSSMSVAELEALAYAEHDAEYCNRDLGYAMYLLARDDNTTYAACEKAENNTIFLAIGKECEARKTTCDDASDDGFVLGTVCEACNVAPCHDALKAVTQSTVDDYVKACEGLVNKMQGAIAEFKTCITKAFKDAPATQKEVLIEMNSVLPEGFDFAAEIQTKVWSFSKRCGTTPNVKPTAEQMEAKVKAAESEKMKAEITLAKKKAEYKQKNGVEAPAGTFKDEEDAVAKANAKVEQAKLDKEEVSGAAATTLSVATAAAAAAFALLF